MNSSFRSVQILVDLMKQFGVVDVVLSPGGSDIPLIHSIETDSAFRCYSVVDERSAAYFAMGMAQQKNKPVACVCTSGTAVCNYVPGITEAFYQNVPVLAITADKNPYYQGQLETQKIEQTKMFEGVVKKSVNLPLINVPEDEWLCNRLVNEALLELERRGKGPVQINVPIVGRTDLYDDKAIPPERRVRIVGLASNEDEWKERAARLSAAKRVLVVVGQNVVFTESDVALLEEFFKRVGCVYAVETLSNLRCAGCVDTYPVSEIRSAALGSLTPDLVLSLGNNLSAYVLKHFLRSRCNAFENWLIDESGTFRDAYKSLTTIFETPVAKFFEKTLQYLPERTANDDYYVAWKKESERFQIGDDLEFSNRYVARKLAEVIPPNSILHTAILNSTRTSQFFKLAPGVKAYSNVGALGIDGCVSTFVGQAAATDELAFLLTGDLSFFYDMNAAGLRNVGPNVRIVLVNNFGGAEFRFFVGKKKIDSINDYISAEHANVAAGWIMSLGYDYYCASDKEEFDAAISKFGQKSDRPMFLEVFSDMETDGEKMREFYQANAAQTGSSKAKNWIKTFLSDKTIEKIKKIVKDLR